MNLPHPPLPAHQNPGNQAAKRLNVCNLFGVTTHSTRRRPPALEIWHFFGTFAVPGYDGPAHLVNKLQQKALRTVLLLLLLQTTATTTTTSGAALFPHEVRLSFYASLLERVDRRLGRSSRRRRRRCCCHGNAYQTHVFWDAFSRFSQTHSHTQQHGRKITIKK